MKKTIVCLLLCTLGMGMFTACHDEDNPDNIIWDYAPITLYLHATDAEGNNLLDPDYEGNILGRNISATFGDSTYHIYRREAETRYYLAHFYGLYLWTDIEPCLTFGEFQGERTYTNESVTIDWQNGQKDVITFSNKLIKAGKIERSYTLNGKKHEGSDFYFVLTE